MESGMSVHLGRTASFEILHDVSTMLAGMITVLIPGT